MKKWFVGLLMMAMALVMIPSVVMAETEVSFYCPSCCEQRTGIKSDTYEYFDQNTHRQRITCKVCNYKGMSVSSAHTETKAATCQSAAYCGDCKSYYGSKAEHNWGDWTTDEKTHKRTCQTPDCGAVDEGSHTWGAWTYYNDVHHYRECTRGCGRKGFKSHSGGKATCNTQANCEVCHEAYGNWDVDNHEHTRTSYANATGEQHWVTVVCEDCNQTVSSTSEAHTWGDWTADGTTHTRTCQSPGCGAVDTGSHTSEPKATCKTAQTCAICNVQYKDLENHEGEVLTNYSFISESQHMLEKSCSSCGDVIFGDNEAHTETTAATCTTAAYCADCKNYYGDPDPDAHDLVQHAAQASTCGGMGWDAYEACSRCSYTTLQELLPKLVHWYGEWSPNADSTHSATCRRGCGDERTVACASCTYQLGAGDAAAAITLCPVCGNVSDGTRLTLAENAAAAALTCALPSGELVARMGAALFGVEHVLRQRDGRKIGRLSRLSLRRFVTADGLSSLGFLGSLGRILRSGLLRARGQRQHHDQRKNQGQQLFHDSSPPCWNWIEYLLYNPFQRHGRITVFCLFLDRAQRQAGKEIAL